MGRFWKHSGGGTSTEYALVAVVVSITIFAGLRAIGIDVAALLMKASNGFGP